MGRGFEIFRNGGRGGDTIQAAIQAILQHDAKSVMVLETEKYINQLPSKSNEISK